MSPSDHSLDQSALCLDLVLASRQRDCELVPVNSGNPDRGIAAPTTGVTTSTTIQAHA